MIDRIENDLAQQPGLTGALMRAAETMQKAFGAAADALRDVAWEVDLERRGRFSAALRQDWAAVSETIEQLLAGDLLDEERRAWLATSVREMLPKPAAPVEVVPAPKARSFEVYGRAATGRKVGAP